ncbi:MAG: hypothetical protein ACTSYS_13770 [Promethearchaeota archaeon]
MGKRGWIDHPVHRAWFDFYMGIDALCEVEDPRTFNDGYIDLVSSISE